MENFWNERYADSEYAYGIKPNEYFEEQLKKINPAKILLPAEGEGRNAVFASKNGWETFAFDISIEGKNKAENLASKEKVLIDYRINSIENCEYPRESFDVLALIFAHFPQENRNLYHRKLDEFVKIGGYVILEAFTKNHLEYSGKNKNLGGPKDLKMLYDLGEIKNDFSNYEILELSESVVEINEGTFHNGQSSVIRFFGKKIKNIE
ncbi:class I SAM-dependent methyltransferase [Candidatus Kaistella beijingensis]|uniref:class I SAM-dependent methyltransferase n=1 Tax=Candidatus Kaistella beijingensis TaxID=2820270 RepID=UPI001CC74586|nr:class I SAM-dependent methyltransferase [Candidatus Kaistella beijingensis]UBB90373.1 class I SAM-dependent methyltransferase [Candidatus Kaistella beijingensis]